MIEQIASPQLMIVLPIALSANPIEWPGPQFLLLFAILYVLAVMMGIVLRMWCLQTNRPAVDPDQLPTSHVAYMRGGEQQMALSSLASLVHKGHLAVLPVTEDDPKSPKRLYAREPLPPDADDVSKLLYKEAYQPWALDFAKLPSVLSNHSTRVQESLEDQGLLVHQRRVFFPAVPLLVVIALGIIKFFVGLSDGRPVLFLFIGLVVCFITLIVLTKLPRLSSAGSSILKSLEQRNSHLNFGTNANYQHLDAGTIAMSVAMFGLATSAMPQMQTLRDTMFDRRSPVDTTDYGTSCTWSGGGSSGCSASGDAGGSSCSGGSGCGGCGGGGGGGD